MNKPYVVYDQRIAGWLMMNGVKLINFRQDRFEPTKNVFVFNNEVKDVEQIIENYREAKSNLDGLFF